MRFFEHEHYFFTPYQSLSELVYDCSAIITDPLIFLANCTLDVTHFLLWSLPLTGGFIALSVPLLLLFPMTLSVITLGLSTLIALALFTSPTISSLSLVFYETLNCLLSPITNILRIMSNIAATFIPPENDDESEIAKMGI